MGVMSDKAARWAAANIKFHAKQPEWAFLFYHDCSPNQHGASIEQWEDEALKVVDSLTEADAELPGTHLHPIREALMSAFTYCWSLRQQGHGVGRLLTNLEFLLEECVSGGAFLKGSNFKSELLVDTGVPRRGIVQKWRDLVKNKKEEQ